MIGPCAPSYKRTYSILPLLALLVVQGDTFFLSMALLQLFASCQLKRSYGKERSTNLWRLLDERSMGPLGRCLDPLRVVR